MLNCPSPAKYWAPEKSHLPVRSCLYLPMDGCYRIRIAQDTFLNARSQGVQQEEAQLCTRDAQAQKGISSVVPRGFLLRAAPHLPYVEPQ